MMARLFAYTFAAALVLVALAASGVRAAEETTNEAHPDEEHTRRLLKEFEGYVEKYDPKKDYGPDGFMPKLTKVEEAKRRRLVLPVAFVGLTTAINAAVKVFSKIVSFFGSTYTEQLVAAHMDNGYSKFKGSSEVFKGQGLPYSRIPAFTKMLARQIGLENPDDVEKMSFMLKWSEYGDSDMWKQNQMTFSVGKGGMCKSFTLYANNDIAAGKMNILWMKTNAEFKLAPNVFVILVSKSRFGGLFSSHKLKFEKVPANIKAKDVQFVNEYFNLIAIQLVADLAGLSVPNDPDFKKVMKKRRDLKLVPLPSAYTLPGRSAHNGFIDHVFRPVFNKAKCWGCRQAKKWADANVCHKQCRRFKRLGGWCDQVCYTAMSCERLRLCPSDPRQTDSVAGRRLGYHSNGIYYPDGAVTIQEYNNWNYDQDEEEAVTETPRFRDRVRRGFIDHVVRPVFNKAKCWGCQQAKKWADANVCDKQCRRFKGLEGWCDQVCYTAMSCERLRLCPSDM